MNGKGTLTSRRDVLVTGGALTLGTLHSFLPLPSAAAKGEIPMSHIYDGDTVFEFRQYTLYSGARDTLIGLFEEQFIGPQNALGARVVATFRDRDDPDRFVWIRAFRDMAARQLALETFYGGPSWQVHRAAANATMVDSDNVLLLRRAYPAYGGREVTHGQPSPLPEAAFGARIFDLATTSPEAFAHFFASNLEPAMAALGATTIGCFLTEPSANNFPVLPVRSDRAFLWLGQWPNQAAECEFEHRWSRQEGWRDSVPAEILPALFRKPERLRLSPTNSFIQRLAGSPANG